MRIAVISDIHANLEATQVVLNTLKALKIDRYICLGDLVGYGASPNEVMELVCPLVDFTVIGNHDAAVVGRMDSQYYYDSAREVISWTQEQLSPENLAYLESLPYLKTEGGVCYVHGEPLFPEYFNYLYTIEQAQEIHKRYEELSPLILVGHSHLRRVYEFSEDGVIELPVENLTLKQDRKFAIAAGSVGQPRDYDPRAGFIVHDVDRRRIEFYRVAYDIDGAAEKIMKAGLPEYFATRLYSGS